MTNPGIYQLFVYGSLRSGFHSPVYEYISRFFKFIGEAKVKGKLFDMGSYPAGIPTHDDCFIVGELYQAKNEHEFSWAIGQLDDYAEVNLNNNLTHAWIYWYNGDVSGRPVIASGDSMEYMQQKK